MPILSMQLFLYLDTFGWITMDNYWTTIGQLLDKPLDNYNVAIYEEIADFYIFKQKNRSWIPGLYKGAL